jgi:zinc/manganese transport system substrate-binding protein
MRMRRRSFLLALATPALAQPRPVLVASFSILGDMLAEVAPQGADIRVLAGPDVDAHHFQPRPSQAEALRGATLALRNGLGLDAWFDRAARGAGFSGVMVTATAGLTARQAPAAANTVHRHEGPDPHAWQDVSLARHYVRQIAAGLGAAGLAGRAEGYDARLAALDGWIREEIGRVPEARRVVLTSHDSFGYFGAAYGVRFLAPMGVSANAEPSAQAVARLIQQVRAQNVSAVFMENIGNPATLRRLASEAGVSVRGRLYADALSAPGGVAASYEAMMRHNVGLLVPAMLG